MADSKARRRQQKEPKPAVGQGGEIERAWNERNAAEDALYREIAKNPDMLPIPSADGMNPAEAILYTGKGAAADIVSGALQMLTSAKAIANSDASKTLQQAFAALWRYLQENGGTIAEIVKAAKTLSDLEPYIKAEIDERAKDPEFSKLTMDDLLADADSSGKPIKSIWNDILEKAQERRQRETETPPAGTDAQRATIKRPEKIDYPLDKINGNVWNLLQSATPTGQLALSVNVAKKGSKTDIPIIYGIDFDELEKAGNVTITRTLTPYDKRVYLSISALFNAGNDIVTMSKIYQTMGYSSRMGATDIKRLQDSITKLAAAHIYINNEQEVKAYPNRPKFRYDASLLPMERVTVTIQGGETETALHLFREPPLTTFAKGRGQITTIAPKLLQSPISKTDQNLMIDDYLIERIARMKNGKGAARKILFSTIYEHCKITGKQRQRTPEKIRKYLNYYQKCGFIAGYTETGDSVEIRL